jgi:hypothetical protein
LIPLPGTPPSPPSENVFKRKPSTNDLLSAGVDHTSEENLYRMNLVTYCTVKVEKNKLKRLPRRAPNYY